MKKSSLFFIIFITLLLFSCKENSINNSKSNNILSPISPYFTDNSDGALAFYSYDSYLLNDINTEDFYVKNYSAYFTNRSSFIDIGSVTAENSALVLSDGYNGQYSIIDYKVTTHPFNNQILWKIKDFLGESGSIVQDIPPRLRIDSAIKTNNYTKISGLSVSYSGSSGIGDLSVEIFIDDFINKATGINISSDPPVDHNYFTKSNNGTINLSSTELSSLIPNRYYQIKITQTNINTVPLGNKTISLLSQTATATYFYLNE